jgi:hypothetical protein
MINIEGPISQFCSMLLIAYWGEFTSVQGCCYTYDCMDELQCIKGIWIRETMGVSKEANVM